MPIVYDTESARTVYLPNGYAAILVGYVRYRAPVTDAERVEERRMVARYLRRVYRLRGLSWGRPEVPDRGQT